MAPQAGFEPATDRLTADSSTTELLWIVFHTPHSDKNYITTFFSLMQRLFKKKRPAFTSGRYIG